MHPHSTAVVSYGHGYVGSGIDVESSGVDGGVVAVLFAIIISCILLLKLQ